jgi:hypothetical protein
MVTESIVNVFAPLPKVSARSLSGIASESPKAGAAVIVVLVILFVVFLICLFVRSGCWLVEI